MYSTKHTLEPKILYFLNDYKTAFNSATLVGYMEYQVFPYGKVAQGI